MAITLSFKQQEVVDFKDKYLLAIAGAGSGKTRVLTERIKKLIFSLKKGEKVLAITFSNKASEELRERLILSLGEEKLNESIFIGTIHKFCLNIVTSRGNLIGLPDDLQICESYNDRLQIFKEAVEANPQFKAKKFGNNSNDNQKVIRELLENLSILKRNLQHYSDIDDEDAKTVYEEYDNLLLQQGIIDFDDILRYAYQILIERPSVSRIYNRVYKYICVDEAQDLNKAQYEIIKALAGNEMGITMVGDPNQAIYGFNGSTSDYLEKNFVEDFNATLINLSENYRSSQKVIEAASIIENTSETKGICPIKGEFEIHEFPSETEEAEYIFEKIKKLVNNGHPDVENGKVLSEQCAVIARNRYVFTTLERMLIENKIDYTMKVSAKGSFSSESDLMKAFELGIRLLVNARDKIHLMELCKLIRTKEKCNTFNDITYITDVSEYWKALIEQLNIAWNILVQSERVLKFYKALEVLKHFVDNNFNMDEHDKILVSGDLSSWDYNWNSYVRKSSPGERNLGNFVRAVSLGSTYTLADKGIVLTTVHMSKGLEYDVVFIMGLNEGVFPDYRAINLDRYYSDKKQLIEERHNMFVAITRSKRLCYLTYPLAKDTPWGLKRQIPSRYINELRAKL